MLRVGLTGELGSGKSTVARLLAARGAVVLSSDEMGRAMMQPGQAVYRAIVDRFGPGVVAVDGALDRRELAQLAFDSERPRVEELNGIVHPAVLAAQEEAIAELGRREPRGMVVVESALIFTAGEGTTAEGSSAEGSSRQRVRGHRAAGYGGGGQTWRQRFDCIVLVTAPDSVKVERFVERMRGSRVLDRSERAALQADAERRLALQRISPELARTCIPVENTGDLQSLERRVDELFAQLRRIRDAMDS